MKVSTVFSQVDDGEPYVKDSPVAHFKDGEPGLHIWLSGQQGPMIGLATQDWLHIVDVVADHLAKRARSAIAAVPDDEGN